ncbi:MAG: hypothetical protein R3E18_01325 [Sphingomonadaceae bacterium]
MPYFDKFTNKVVASISALTLSAIFMATAIIPASPVLTTPGVMA